MDGESYLYALVEAGVALAGFSAIALALESRGAHQLDRLEPELIGETPPSHLTPPRSSSHLTSVSGKSGEVQFSAPLHTHTHAMKLVILAGTYIQGPEGQPEFRLGPSSYLLQPGGTYRHTTSCDPASECIFFVESNGAFDLQSAAAEIGSGAAP